MASAFYPKVFNHLLKGDVDLDTATVKVLLIGGADAYTYDARDEFVSELSGELSTSGTGYERKTVSVTLSVDVTASDDADAGVFINFDLTNDATWGPSAPVNPAAATFTARHAVMFIDSGSDATSKLLYYFDLGADQVVSSGTFQLLDPNPQPKLRRA
jgi:hypothetical protein